MYQPEDNLNLDPSQEINSKQNPNEIDPNLSPQNVASHKKQLEGIFVKLITFGLIFGAIMAGGVYYVINKFGLNKKPYQMEQEKIEQQKQQKPPFKEIIYFPEIPESSNR